VIGVIVTDTCMPQHNVIISQTFTTQTHTTVYVCSRTNPTLHDKDMQLSY